jgi:hypothetical protein
MISTLRGLVSAARRCLSSLIDLQLEVLALQQQIHILERSRRARPRITRADRFFWVWLSRVWTGWRRSASSIEGYATVTKTSTNSRAQTFRQAQASDQAASRAITLIL